MEVKNPYLKRKRELLIEIDTQKTNRNLTKVLELEEELKALEGKERAFLQGIIDDLTSDIQKVEDRVEVIKEKFKTKREQYAEVVELKRVVQGQVLNGKKVREGIIDKLRDLAKELR